MKPVHLETNIVKVENVTADACSVYFIRPENFSFEPGQYMKLTLDLKEPDERGDSRFYSIASSPTETDYLMITTRRITSVFKKTLIRSNPNTKVKIFAPLGTFMLHEPDKPHIFLAGGIGITPFRSMIRYCLDNNMTRPIILFNSVKTPDDIVYARELKDIALRKQWFKYIVSVTKPENSKTPWYGHTGRINTHLLMQHIEYMPSSLFYIAGPPAMVEEMITLVKSFNVPDTQIYKERFTGY